MLRPLLRSALLVVALAFARSAVAQPPPAPTATGTPAPATRSAFGDPELRERLARMEENANLRQEEVKRLREEQGKLKDRIDAVKEKQDGFWTPFGPGLGVVVIVFTTAASVLIYLFGFFFPKARTSIVEEGRPALVRSALSMLEQDERLPQLLEAHRKEMVRLVLAKDVRILIEGDDGGSVGDLLKKSGYRRYATTAEQADVIVLVGKDLCHQRARELMPTAFVRDQKPVVLYAPPGSLDKGLLADLDRETLVVAANSRATVVTHVGMLAALMQRSHSAKV
jgi:hypothetical protein